MQYYSWSILRVSHTTRVVLCFLLFLSSLNCCSLPPALCSFSTLHELCQVCLLPKKVRLRSQSNLSHLREPNHGAAVAQARAWHRLILRCTGLATLLVRHPSHLRINQSAPAGRPIEKVVDTIHQNIPSLISHLAGRGSILVHIALRGFVDQ